MAKTSNPRRTPATAARRAHARRTLSACIASATLATIAACGNGSPPPSLEPNDGDAPNASAAVEGQPPSGATDANAALALPRSQTTTPMANGTEQPAPLTGTPRERGLEPQVESIPDSKGALTQIDVSQYETYWFRAPSNNIACLMLGSDSPDGDATVRCTIVSKEWRSPAKPETCPLEWGSDLEIDADGRPRFVCAGDTVLGASSTVDYGTHLIMKPGLTCTITANGVTCANRFTAQGFFISREKYRLF